MWSPVTRSIPAEAALIPRKMLPPPTTSASSTPMAWIAAISSESTPHDVGIDAEARRAHQGLARELEQDPAVAQRVSHAASMAD